MDYLNFALVFIVLLLFVLALFFSARTSGKEHPGLHDKAGHPAGDKHPPDSKNPAQNAELGGQKYIPTYQDNPDVAEHIARFLDGATRGDNPEEQGLHGADALAADGIDGDLGESDTPAKQENRAADPDQIEAGVDSAGENASVVNE